METAIDWRRRYLDALREAEAESRQWYRLEQLLRRIVSRLAAAACGWDPQADQHLHKLAAASRLAAAEPELAELFEAVTAALATSVSRKVETSPAESPEPRAATPTTARAALLQLLDRLATVEDLHDRAGEIARSLTAAADETALVHALEEVVNLVGEQQARVEHERAQAASVLSQVTGRLDEMAGYLSTDREDRAAVLTSTADFDANVVKEVRALSGQVASATDLVILQNAVKTRISAIDAHLDEFRDREAARARAYDERAERMTSRVRELESETRQLQRNLTDEQRLSLTDPLTGMPNRMAWDRRIVEEIARWRRFQLPTCVATWDLDRFKSINDTWGHKAGDKVIRTVGGLLADSIRGTDFVARVGGEEFVMLLVGAPVADALVTCNRLRERIAALGFHFRGAPVGVTASCGLSALAAGDGPDEVFERADRALYRAKEGGRNRCESG